MPSWSLSHSRLAGPRSLHSARVWCRAAVMYTAARPIARGGQKQPLLSPHRQSLSPGNWRVLTEAPALQHGPMWGRRPL